MRPTDIAIISLACRMPGGCDTPEAFWELLAAGRDAVTEIPEGRWPKANFTHPGRQTPGRAYTTRAGVLDDVAGFDAGFFGISPREAEQMDPQQRLLLEMAWEALERGGQVPSRLAGGDTAVYVGISGTDYADIRQGDPSGGNSQFMLGSVLSIAANRLSYIFDLHGPSMAVDTACSSSLVALHEAVQCLRAGRAPAALVGGINMLLSPFPFVGFSRASMLSPYGQCRAFDAVAEGYVRAEGGGIMLLKPLDAALADGDPVEAVIRGVNVNTDGRTNGIALPAMQRQTDLLQRTYAEAGVDPADVDYFEAHGTGTSVGDPSEAEAIGRAIGQGRPADRPLPIGSVKTNVGHMEPAAGMAGILKAVGVLRHKTIPPSLHFDTPNPNIDFDGLNIAPSGRTRVIETGDRPALVGVNSFGFGGVNAHVILEEYRGEGRRGEEGATSARVPESAAGTPPPLYVSARDEAALQAMAGRLARALAADDAPARYDAAYTLALRREQHAHRLVVRRTGKAATRALATFAETGESQHVTSGRVLAAEPQVALLFGGNGAQWVGMGRQLLDEDAVFARTIAQVDALVQARAGWSVAAEMRAEAADSRMGDTRIDQPLIFAVQVGLYHSLLACGLQPAAMAGHSVGEVAAAHCAGVLDLEQAVHVIVSRSDAQAETRGQGRMAACEIDETRARAEIAAYDGAVELACVNGPSSVTLCGDPDALVEIGDKLKGESVPFRLLDLDYAFHNKVLDPVQERVLSDLAEVTGREATTRFFSSVTGGELPGGQVDAGYWWRNMRHPVQFHDAVRAMSQAGCTLFLEISPHPIMQSYVRSTLRALGAEGQAFAAMTQRAAGAARVPAVVDELWCAGAPLDWGRIFPARGRVAALPTYAFQRETYWFPQTPEATGLIFRPRLGRLLGTQPLRDLPVFETEIDPELFPDLADHVVGGSVIFPAAGFLELALEAAQLLFDDGRAEIETLELRRPLVLEAGRTKVVRVVYDQAGGGSLRIESRTRLHDEPWSTHAEGRMTRLAQPQAPAAPETARPNATRVAAADHYAGAASLGLAYGPAFQTVQAVAAQADGATVELAAPSGAAAGDYVLDPALFDGCLQALFDVLALRDPSAGQATAYLPQQFGRFRWFAGGTPVRADVRLDRLAARSAVATFTLLDAEGRVVAIADRLRFAQAELGSRRHASGLYHEFEPVALVPRAPSARPELADPATLLPDDPGSAPPELDELAGAFAWAALKDLGAGDSGHVEDLAAAVPTDRLALLTHLVDLASQAGAIVLDAEGDWQRADGPELDAEALFRRRLAERPDALAELTVLGRCGRHLAELLRGADWETVAPSAAVRDQLSAAGPAFGPGSEALCDAAVAAAARAGDGRALRVLEIHASGAPLVGRLRARLDPASVSIVFASADAEARAHVEADFGPADAVSVAPFDPSSPLAEQDGLVPGDADIVIGAGVLEAHGEDVLARLSEALTADGLLLLAERRGAPWLALTDHQLLERWVDGTERDADGWQELLFRSGWRRPAARPVAQSDIIAAQRPAVRSAQSRLSGSWVVVLDSQPVAGNLGEALADQLTQAGGEAILVQPGETYHRDGNLVTFDVTRDPEWRTLWRDLADAGTQVRGVVHLLGLARAGTDGEPLDAVQGLRAWTAALMVRTLAASSLAQPSAVALATGGALAPGRQTLPQDGALVGMARVLRNENPGLNLKLLDLPQAAPTRALDALLAELHAPDNEGEVRLDAGTRTGLRLRRQRLPEPQDQPSRPAEPDVRLSYQTGALERLHWGEGSRRAPAPHEVEIRVAASGLNFRDVMFALGVLPDEAVENGFSGATIGMECAGTVTRVGADVDDLAVGDAVMAFAPGCFAGHVTTAATAVAHKPAALDPVAAATVPTVFFTVYYALARLAQLEPGERVLIHGAAGGVGQAAIQYARHVGAEIFATAGTPEKRDLVRLLGVPEAHILDSRSLAFAEDIRRLTGGTGVDVVLNSLAGEAVEKNLSILRPFGRFLELGKRDFFEGTRVGLRPFRNNVSYFGIDADQLMVEKPQLARRLFAEVGELFDRGVFAPLPYRLYRHDEVVQAFRDMQQARHVGKLVIAPPPAPAEAAAPAPASAEPAAPQAVGHGFRIDPAGRYLVTGGLGGFGLATAQWLAEQGARDLVLVSRSGPKSDEAKQAVAQLEAEGVAVEARAVDVADAEAVARLVDEVDRPDAPLKGVVHAAAVFDDVLSAEMTRRQLDAVLAPKADGAWALHRATLDRALELFVMYSSVTTAFGNPGQANYVAANAFLEALAQHRRALGLPALAVCWGPIADKGYLARNAELTDQLSEKLGAEPLTTAGALAELGRLLDAGVTRMTVAPVDWRKLYGKLPGLRAAAFAEVTAGARDGEAGEAVDLRQLVHQLSPEELKTLLVDTLREEIGQVLRLPADKVDPSKSVFDLGMDSLMAVELRMSVEERLGVEVPAMALGEGISIAQLAERLRDGVVGTGEPADDTEASVRDLLARHDESLDAEAVQAITETAGNADSRKSGS